MGWRGSSASKSTERGTLYPASRPRRTAAGRPPARRRARAVGQLHRRLHLLAPLLVGDPEHGDVGHRRVLDERLLDLGRVDVHAARDDHVGGPVGEEHEAVLVDVADVAHREGAGRKVGGVGLLLGLVVLEDLVGDQVVGVERADLARREALAVGVGREHLVARDRLATVPGLVEPRVESTRVNTPPSVLPQYSVSTGPHHSIILCLVVGAIGAAPCSTVRATTGRRRLAPPPGAGAGARTSSARRGCCARRAPR